MWCIHSSWTLLFQNLQRLFVWLCQKDLLFWKPLSLKFKLLSGVLGWTVQNWHGQLVLKIWAGVFTFLHAGVFDINKMDINEKLRRSSKIFTSCRCWKVIMLSFQKGRSSTVLSTSAEDPSATDSVYPHYPSPGHSHAQTIPAPFTSFQDGFPTNPNQLQTKATDLGFSVQILSNMTSPKRSKLLISSISQHFYTNVHLISAELLPFLQSFLKRDGPMNYLDTETLLL